MNANDPWPWTKEVAEAALERLAAGAAWKQVFEAALLDLDDEHADRLMLLVREARGAWLPFLESAGGRALCVGNACSGAQVALARAGFEVTLLDASPTRLALGRAQGLALAGRAPSTVCAPSTASGQGTASGEGTASGQEMTRASLALSLPFADGAFDVVLAEHGLPQAGAVPTATWTELLRIGREVVVTVNNRFGYKRSRGRRADFRVPGPLAWFVEACRPPRDVRSIAGHRRALGEAGASRVRSFALYPHLADFTHVVGLDGAGPALMLGPKERKNRIKVLAHAAGLFPVFTPSFALIGASKARPPRGPARLEHALDVLAERLGEGRPVVEHVQATRGNTALVLTRLPQGRRTDDDTEAANAEVDGDPRGRWVLHIPLSEQQRVQLVQHHARLGLIRERFPTLPVPEPLFLGELVGMTLACERRLGGLTAPQFTGDTRVAARLFADAARDFAGLVMRPTREFDERDFERLIESRIEIASRTCASPPTVARLARLCEEARAALLGARLPLVLQHADLRSKHVQVREDGSVIGYLDWGPSELEDLPFFDVLHLVVHERKHEAGLSAAAAWRLARERRELRPHERAALDDHAARLGLDERVRSAIEALYPVIVASMAERNWDYSRPRWLARQFQI